MGGFSRFEEKHNVSHVGLRRKVNAKREAEKASGGEFMDLSRSLIMMICCRIDKEEVEKTSGKREVRDVKKHKELLRKLIKDEQDPEPPKSPNTDSDDDEAGEKEIKATVEVAVTAEVDAGVKGYLAGATVVLWAAASRTPPGTAGRPASVARSQPPSTNVSRAGTPQLQEFKELLPKPGSLPTEAHVAALLKALIQQKGAVKLKELIGFFDRNTAEQKSNLSKIMKSICQLREETPGSKVFFVSLRKSV